LILNLYLNNREIWTFVKYSVDDPPVDADILIKRLADGDFKLVGGGLTAGGGNRQVGGDHDDGVGGEGGGVNGDAGFAGGKDEGAK